MSGEMTAFRERVGQVGPTVVLVDLSGSMTYRAGGKSRIEILREALASLWPVANGRLIYFSHDARQVESPDLLPEPCGGTALDLGLIAAAEHRPARTIVLSDGEPNDKTAALNAAKWLTGVIETIFCGSDGDREAIAFMRRLATLGCGGSTNINIVRSGSRQLANTLRPMLEGPAARAIEL